MSIAPIKFVDRGSGDEGVVLVRVLEDSVGLALSLRKNGDIEVVFGSEELDQVIVALQTARRTLLTHEG
ncbi:hypothetical protein [uncultured Bradyrhizobium sp.]|uniref:hypothetical protein n=1 Tax=Bradyrhizobium sp. TaxID=376 RepID=UPI002612812E|nr:hypothetical protein [uncultured Bradyrhizobium sp.]